MRSLLREPCHAAAAKVLAAPDPDSATTFIVGQMTWLFDKLDDVGERRAEANLHEVMAAHAREDGVLLGSGAWIVTARRS